MHYSKVSFLIDKTLPLVLSKMGCYKLTYYPKETLSRVRGGKAWREENDEWVWLSVDPLAHMFPHLTPYNYTMNNPVNMTDPDGRAAICETCPEGDEFNVFREHSGNWEYDNESGGVRRTDIDNPSGSPTNPEGGGTSPSDNNGIDPSVSGGLAVGGGMTEGVKQSYQNDAKNSKVKSAERVNGRVRNADVVSRGNRAHANNMAGHAKNLGRGFTVLSIGAAGYELANSDRSGSDYARFTGTLIITGSAAIPFVGPIISIGLGVADSYGAFDSVYEYFD